MKFVLGLIVGLPIGAYLWNRYGYDAVMKYNEVREKIKSRLEGL